MKPDRNRIKIPGELEQKILQVARTLRKNPTRSETLLWQELRGKRLNGIKFRRQQPIGPFIVDFYAACLRLVIEIDGDIHLQQQDADQSRQLILESLDLVILRFSTSQVETDIHSVLSAICLKAGKILFGEEEETPSAKSLPQQAGKGRFAPLSVYRRGVGGEVPSNE
jgi:very-short-patch-repair endonuclease